eukprot:RCo045703
MAYNRFTSSNVELLSEEKNSIRHSHRQLDEISGMGTAVMEALRSQRERMEGSRGKLYNIAASLGISQSVLKTIQRTEKIDRTIGCCPRQRYCFWGVTRCGGAFTLMT